MGFSPWTLSKPPLEPENPGDFAWRWHFLKKYFLSKCIEPLAAIAFHFCYTSFHLGKSNKLIVDCYSIGLNESFKPLPGKKIRSCCCYSAQGFVQTTLGRNYGQPVASRLRQSGAFRPLRRDCARLRGHRIVIELMIEERRSFDRFWSFNLG